MVDFTAKAAADYDRRIPRLVPGYDLFHALVPSLLASLVPNGGQILVMGAGTGREILALARQRRDWHLTAVDPSAAMLARARQRLGRLRLGKRVTYHVGDAASFRGDIAQDAALSLLVGHFIADDGQRLGFLTGLAANLAAGAPLILVELAEMGSDALAFYHQWALDQGNEPVAVAAMFARFRAHYHLLTPSRLADLLDHAGFTRPEPFFQAFGFRGVIAHRRGR